MSDEDFNNLSFHGGDAPVSTYMADGVVTLPPTATMRAAADLIADASVGCIVVGSNDAVTGIVSERDIVLAVARGLDLETATLDQMEPKRLIWVSPDSTMGEVAAEMMEDYVRHVLVGNGSSVAGVLSMRDVIAAYTT
jgi:CBS domain-containing protein